jgi:hypothetical protein
MENCSNTVARNAQTNFSATLKGTAKKGLSSPKAPNFRKTALDSKVKDESV